MSAGDANAPRAAVSLRFWRDVLGLRVVYAGESERFAFVERGSASPCWNSAARAAGSPET